MPVLPTFAGFNTKKAGNLWTPAQAVSALNFWNSNSIEEGSESFNGYVDIIPDDLNGQNLIPSGFGDNSVAKVKTDDNGEKFVRFEQAEGSINVSSYERNFDGQNPFTLFAVFRIRTFPSSDFQWYNFILSNNGANTQINKDGVVSIGNGISSVLPIQNDTWYAVLMSGKGSKKSQTTTFRAFGDSNRSEQIGTINHVQLLLDAPLGAGENFVWDFKEMLLATSFIEDTDDLAKIEFYCAAKGYNF